MDIENIIGVDETAEQSFFSQESLYPCMVLNEMGGGGGIRPSGTLVHWYTWVDRSASEHDIVTSILAAINMILSPVLACMSAINFVVATARKICTTLNEFLSTNHQH